MTLVRGSCAVQPQAQLLSGSRWASLPSGKRALRLTARILSDSLLPEGKGAIGEMQIAMTGEWEGHSEGPFALTESDIDCMIEVFSKQSAPLTIDYNHASVPEGRAATAEEGKAAGWIRSLAKRMGERGAELWAEVVEWTEEATARISAGEYAFCSPVFLFGSTDRVSGEEVDARIFNVALTNTPFLDGMAPVRLSETSQGSAMPDEMKPEDDKQAVPAADKPEGDEAAKPEASADAPAEEPKPDAVPAADEPKDGDEAERDGNETTDASTSDVSAQLIDDIAKQIGTDAATVVDVVRRNFDAFTKALNDIVEKDGQATARMTPVAMSETAKAAEVQARFVAAKEERMQAQIKKLSETVAELKAERDAIKASEVAAAKAAKAAEIEAIVDAKIKSGHVLLEKREDAIWLFTQDRARAESIYADAIVPLGTQQAPDIEIKPVVGDGTKLKFSDLTGEALVIAKAAMPMARIVDGKRMQFSEHDACKYALEKVEGAKTARRVG